MKRVIVILSILILLSCTNSSNYKVVDFIHSVADDISLYKAPDTNSETLKLDSFVKVSRNEVVEVIERTNCKSSAKSVLI